MAGARIEIQLDASQAQAALHGIGNQLGPDAQALLLKDIGEYLLKATRDRAAGEVSPAGTPWAALSPRYAARKAKQRPGLGLLKFDNHMLGDKFSFQVSPGEVLVGTNAPYGARQQFGGGGIPARPWLGVSDADDEGIAELVIKRLQGGLAGGGVEP